MASKEELNKKIDEIVDIDDTPKEIKEEKSENMSFDMDKLMQSIKFDVGNSEAETRRYFMQKLITEYPFGANVKMGTLEKPESGVTGIITTETDFEPKIVLYFMIGNPSGTGYISIGFATDDGSFILRKGSSSTWYSETDGAVLNYGGSGQNKAYFSSTSPSGFDTDWTIVNSSISLLSVSYIAIG